MNLEEKVVRALEGLIKFCALVKDIVSNDEELIEAYRRFEQDHDKMREKQKKESENRSTTVQIYILLCQTLRQSHL